MKVPTYSYVTRHGKLRGRVWVDGSWHYMPGEYRSEESLETYARFVREWEAAHPETDFALSIGELLLLYWPHVEEYYRKNGRPTSTVCCIRSALKPLAERFAGLPIRDFGPRKLRLVREDMIALGWSRSTINDYTSRIRQFVRWCVSHEYAPPELLTSLEAVEPLRAGRTKARETPRVTPVDRDDIRAIAPFVSRLVWLAVNLQLKTGMRSGELLAMRYEDLLEEAGVLVYQPREHKTQHKGKDRVVAIGPKGRLILEQVRRETGGGEWLFAAARDRSRPMTRDVYRRAIQRACDRAGVERWHPHRLRHNRGTEVRSQFGIEAARQTLGVSSMDVAAIYAEQDRRRATEIAAALG